MINVPEDARKSSEFQESLPLEIEAYRPEAITQEIYNAFFISGNAREYEVIY
jgi:hypothetical protein